MFSERSSCLYSTWHPNFSQSCASSVIQISELLIDHSPRRVLLEVLRSSLTFHCEAVDAAFPVEVTGDDSIGGDATHCGDWFSVRADDVFEHAVLVEEAIGVPFVADDDAVIVNAYE